ncbi:hypothetical protein [Stackebrandtia nassauensis]|uniref:Uncharacterized protein n=1 Tax=Stackebrandtia nassauensis (strain DSM 44728 / CIP 108903 / NRRL B-16338 / NBRC 102104 / LLR-40K-21) TaxID=446470 RepID=D3Q0L9_STANL|nr:hypothetical protein [Stackebrandtia nassauensis]ADD41755.1 hypothetical protein Snas_2061 [Stackebrandtia nassauensis DSM 44728]
MSLSHGHRGTDVRKSAVTHADLVTGVRRTLAHLPGAADLVIGHVFCGEPLPVMARRLRIPLAQAPGLLRQSLKLLRPIMSETEFAGRRR